MATAESQSLWATKPWWCQPWSIVLTGLIIPIVSWFLLHILWLTIAASISVLLWWLLFLVLAPAAYQQAAGEPGNERPPG